MNRKLLALLVFLPGCALFYPGSASMRDPQDAGSTVKNQERHDELKKAKDDYNDTFKKDPILGRPQLKKDGDE